VQGSRILQGYALMSHLVELGWVCLSVEYRVAPHHRWPRPIQDVKAAIAWARANVDQFGGDREFVAITGCSAGAHLAALAGLTPNAPEFQSELPAGAYTTVDAVVGIYGRYDWEGKSTAERVRFVDFLERAVVKRRISEYPSVFRDGSPIARVRRDVPPFMVVHGTGDTLIPVAQARDFVERLRDASHSVVSYLEYPGAGHAFDMTDGARTGSMSVAVGLFLNEMRRRHSVSKQAAVSGLRAYQVGATATMRQDVRTNEWRPVVPEPRDPGLSHPFEASQRLSVPLASP
jgi:acetyl esterase/lipase